MYFVKSCRAFQDFWSFHYLLQINPFLFFFKALWNELHRFAQSFVTQKVKQLQKFWCLLYTLLYMKYKKMSIICRKWQNVDVFWLQIMIISPLFFLVFPVFLVPNFLQEISWSSISCFLFSCPEMCHSNLNQISKWTIYPIVHLAF